MDICTFIDTVYAIWYDEFMAASSSNFSDLYYKQHVLIFMMSIWMDVKE